MIFNMITGSSGGGGGVGEVVFEGSMAITNTTNLWEYINDSVDARCYVMLVSNLYVNNTAMNMESPWIIYYDRGYSIPERYVCDSNDDDGYRVYFVFDSFSQSTTLQSSASLRGTVTKIIKIYW